MRTWRLAALMGSLALLVAACGPDETDGTDEEETGATWEAFNSNVALVTSGTDVGGEEVQGEATLSWETSGAAGIEVTADGEALDLSECEPAQEGAEDCVGGGSLTVEPTEDTTYALEVYGSEGGSCETQECRTEIEVGVVPPATLAIDRESQIFAPGRQFQAQYSVDVPEEGEWTIGALADGELTACELPADEGDAPCVLADDQGAAATEGELTVKARDSGITLSGTAENGAQDGLGDIAPGDVTLELTPAGVPMIDSFGPDGESVDVEAGVTLEWATVEATGVELSVDDSTGVETNLADCADISDDGTGSCDVEFTDEAVGREVTFELVALGEADQSSDPATATIQVGNAATVDEFTAEPAMLPEGGGDTELSWETSNAESLTIVDGEDNTYLDTENDDGTGDCTSEASGCNLDEDAIPVTGVDSNTSFTLTAQNQFGSDATEVQVTLEDAPQITKLDFSGKNLLDSDFAPVDADSGSLEWETMNADSVMLEYGAHLEAGCQSEDIAWTEDQDFDADPNDGYNITGIDSAEQCYRLTARGAVGQTATEAFNIVRVPSVDGFEAGDQTVTEGATIDLSWTTTFAKSVDVTSSSVSAVSSTDLDACSGVDDAGEGSCEVTIQRGTSADEVTLELTAVGGAGVESNDTASVTVEIGEVPTIDKFDSTSSTTSGSDVDLTWNVASTDQVTIVDDSGSSVCTESSPTNNQDQTCTASSVSETTTWTLTASNSFGEVTAQTTTFVGPQVDKFTVEGVDALSGGVAVETGEIEFVWETTGTETVDLLHADVPESGTCVDAGSGDFSEVETGAGSDDSTVVSDFVRDGCFQLVANGASETSAVTVEVSDLPFETSIAIDPEDVDRQNPETIDVDMEISGASTMTLRAHYLDGNGDPAAAPREVCDETSLEEGSLSHDDSSPTKNQLRCQHEHDDYECDAGSAQPVPGSNAIPEDTADIEYELTYTDPEGDEVTVYSSKDAYEQNVVVTENAVFCD